MLMGLLDSILNLGSTAATNRANERIQNSINETNTANVNATNEANRQIAEATNKANVQMNEANNAANRELAELQNTWNLEQWQRENEYNSPAAQMERLISAGLTPAAAAAAVTNGNAASLQSAPLANQAPSHIDPYQLQAAQVEAYQRQAPNFAFTAGEVLDFMAKQTSLRSLELDNKAKELNVGALPDFIFTDLERQKAVTELEKFQLSSAQQTFPYQLGAQKASLQNLQDTHKLNKIAMQVQQQSLRQMRSDFDWLNQMRPVELSKMVGEVQTQMQQIKESDARIAELTKQLDYINAKIAETGASTANIEQRTKIERELSEYQKRTASAEAVQSEVTSTLARFGMPENIAGRTAALLSSGQLSPREFERSLQSINYYFKNGERVLKEDAAGYLKYVYDPTDVKDRDFWSKQLWNALDIGAKGLGVYQLTKPKAGATPIRGFSK